MSDIETSSRAAAAASRWAVMACCTERGFRLLLTLLSSFKARANFHHTA